MANSIRRSQSVAYGERKAHLEIINTGFVQYLLLLDTNAESIERLLLSHINIRPSHPGFKEIWK